MATSHWDAIDLKVGESREDELKTDFWKEALDGGAFYKRVRIPQSETDELKTDLGAKTSNDIEDTVEHILTNQFDAVVTKIQAELVEWDKRVAGTDAGETLTDTLQKRAGGRIS
jgi:hypothetical protein